MIGPPGTGKPLLARRLPTILPPLTPGEGLETPRQVRKFCALKPEAAAILKAAREDLGLSARAHDKVLRLARTIADLEGHDDIRPQHIAEAVGHRSLQ